MLVFRIENKDGKGLYSSGLATSVRGYCYLYYLDDTHPEPCDDGIKGFTSEHYCGFSTVEQFKKWTLNMKSRKALDDNGGFLCVYNVSSKNVIVGNKQCVFVKGKSRKVATYKVTEFD